MSRTCPGHHLLWVCALLVVLSLGQSSCGSGEGESGASRRVEPRILPSGEVSTILLVALDGVPVRHSSAYGYERETTPFLAQLAESGATFESALADSLGTNAGLASLATGLPPDAHGVGSLRQLGAHRLAAGLTTLAEELVSAGWRSAGSVALPQLGASISGIDAGFERWLAPEIDEAPYRDARQVAYRLLRATEDLVAGDDKLLLLAHFTDARREAGAPAPEGARFLDSWLRPYVGQLPVLGPSLDRLDADPAGAMEDLRKALGRGRGSAPHVAWREGLRDGAIGFADQQLGLLLDALEASGRLDSTLICVSGISGAAPLETEQGGPGFAPGLVEVPLLFHGPGVSARRVEGGPVQPHAVAGTLLSLAGLPSGGREDLSLVVRGADPVDALAWVWSTGLERSSVFGLQLQVESSSIQGHVLYRRSDGARVEEAALEVSALAEAEALREALFERQLRPAFGLRYGAVGDEELAVRWRFLRGHFEEGHATGGVQTGARGVPREVGGQARLNAPSPTLELTTSGRDLPLSLVLSADREVAAEQVLVGPTPLSRSFLPRLPAKDAGPWPEVDGAPAPYAAELEHHGGAWWRVEVGGTALPGGTTVRALVVLYPPRELDAELSWTGAESVEVTPVQGRPDAIWIEGRTPLELQIKKSTRDDIALAIEAAGRQLSTSELRYRGKRFAREGELELYVPDWIGSVTEDLDREPAAEPPPGSITLYRVGAPVAPEDRAGLSARELTFVRRLPSTE